MRRIACFLVACAVATVSCLAGVGGGLAPALVYAAPATEFRDTGGHWAAPVISLLASRRVVAGFPDDTFQPETTLTRAQFAKLAVAGLEGQNTADLLHPAAPVFSDLRGHWARGWVAAGFELGLVRGVGAGLYAPDQGMSRAEVAAVLVRALGWDDEAQSMSDAVAAAYLSRYSDAGDVPAWALAYLALATQRGLLLGYADGSLRPGGLVTRAEAATLLARALDRLALLYDLGGRLVDVTADGRVVLEQLWGRPDQASRLTLTTAPETVWLRNGLPVEPAELVSGDSVLIILGEAQDRAGGKVPALCVAALAWDLIGQVTSVDVAGGRMTLQTGGTGVAVHAGPGSQVVRHGEKVNLAAVTGGDRAYVLIDPLTGIAQVIDAIRPELSGTVVAVRAGATGATIDLLPAGTTGSGGASGQSELRTVGLAPAAKLYVDGLPGRATDVVAGMQIVLALPGSGGTGYGYGEAWNEPAVAAGTQAAARTAVTTDTATAASIAPGDAAFAPLGGVFQGGEQGRTASVVVEAAFATQDPAPVHVAQAAGPFGTGTVGISVSETGAPVMWADYGADGTGVTIAVIDTGVDASHAILQQTTSGRAKIVDWVDMTGEGWVNTVSAVRSFGGYVTTSIGRVRLGYYASRSGIYRTGVIRESELPGPAGQGLDLNNNGRKDDAFAVILVDVRAAGVYDTVFIDTNGDLDVRDEAAMEAFKVGGSLAVFRGAGGSTGLGVVIAQLDRLGGHVVLGFDGNGHGTHVAGVAAGHDPAGSIKVAGMAPGAQLMVIKALASDGGGTWTGIRAGVEYAAANGADLAVLAIEGPDGGSAVSEEYEQIVAAAAQYGMLLFVAGGNAGPGLLTAASSPDEDVLIPVGGYIAAGMWQSLYGHAGVGDSVWLYNSCGPAQGGGVAPFVLAPAAAVSSVPRLLAASGYDLYEGTSMAAPHGAGAAALLIDYARARNWAVGARQIARALADGARKLGPASRAEQGFGVLAVPAAALALGQTAGRTGATPPKVQINWASASPRAHMAALGTDWLLRISNPGNSQVSVGLTAADANVQIERANLVLSPGQTRSVRLDAADALVAGIDHLDDLVTARDLVSGLILGATAVSVVPYVSLPPETAGSLEVTGVAEPARSARHYVSVPVGCRSLRIETALDPGQSGAAEAFIYSPGGQLVARTGLLDTGTTRRSSVSTIASPPPGVWEVVVAAAAGNARPLAHTVSCAASAVVVSAQPDTVQRQSGRQLEPEAVTVSLEVPDGSGNLAIEVYGWLAQDKVPITLWHIDSMAGTASRAWVMPAIESGVGIAEICLTGLSPGDADLYVYRLDDGPAGQWREIATSRIAGRTAERVLLWNPAPGQYAVVAEGQVAGQTYAFAASVTLWPAGTMILASAAVPPAVPGTGSQAVDLSLPAPAGAVGTLSAHVLVRAADTFIPLASTTFRLEIAEEPVIAVIAPSLSAQSAAPAGGNLALPRLTALASVTHAKLRPVVTAYGRRSNCNAAGHLRLGANVLGFGPRAGESVALRIASDGYHSWAGVLTIPGPSRLSAATRDPVGRSPYAWPAGTDGLRTALRRKATLAAGG